MEYEELKDMAQNVSNYTFFKKHDDYYVVVNSDGNHVAGLSLELVEKLYPNATEV